MPDYLTRIDLTHHNGRTALRVWTPDGNEWLYPLNPSEGAAIVSRLAGALQRYVTDNNIDRTADTVAANPDVFQEPAA